MILHGVESPNIIHKNTLEDNIQEIQNKDRVNVILANPPFGGKEKEQIQENGGDKGRNGRIASGGLAVWGKH